MKRLFKIVLLLILALLLAAGTGLAWWMHSKQPQRSGTVAIPGLHDTVSIRYDERGVPHITAKNETDMYRALGYVQAQDRLFQMEMVRRLARGQLAEILGPELLPVDRLFRSMRIDEFSRTAAAGLDHGSAMGQAIDAYLGGVNAFQDTHPSPLEFDLVGIPKHPFTVEDSFAVSGYMAYSFARSQKSAPVMSYIRDRLGADYLKDFDLPGQLGNGQSAHNKAMPYLAQVDWAALNRVALINQTAAQLSGVPPFIGSNAWAIAGQHTASGKPLLAGDPHIAFSTPAVWYEAHLNAPGFELYGHFQPIVPFALLGHNLHSGWSLTMFENTDLDLIAEKTNPANPNQVWYQDHWEDLQVRDEIILVKGAAPEHLQLKRSHHGPIINDALSASAGSTTIAVWWAFLETSNSSIQAFYDLPRADTLDKARAAAEKIHAPGLNLIWANATGDIGWWAAAMLPQRPAGADPSFILDGSKPEAEKPGFYPFSENPQEENPARGYIVSANQQPATQNGLVIPGNYLPPYRAQRIDELLRQPGVLWDTHNTQAVQLDVRNPSPVRVIQNLLPLLRLASAGTADAPLVEKLAAWNGDYLLDTVEPTLGFAFSSALANTLMADRLGPERFKALLDTYLTDPFLERVSANPQSVWWAGDQAGKVRSAWLATLSQLRSALGEDPALWTWGRAHTLTHAHPLGRGKLLGTLFNVGPFAAPGGHEAINDLSSNFGPAPWAVTSGPSTRRIIDFANPAAAIGINPVGQSGVLGDAHYADQSLNYMAGIYVPMHFAEVDVAKAAESTLMLVPAH